MSSTSEVSDRYRRVAEGFTARVNSVPPGAWDQPSPCGDWVARDVVTHVTDASAMFLRRAGVELAAQPGEDPVRAWEVARDAVQAALADPTVANRQHESKMGPTTLERSIATFGIGDVLVHTWDLARATGLDEHLDPDEVRRLFDVMRPMDTKVRGVAFGPKVEPPAGADEQTLLLSFTGRHV